MLFAEVSVLTGRDTNHQIIPQRVGAVLISKRKWIDNVTGALAHLSSRDVPPAMDKKLRHLLIRKSERVEHDQPVNSVGRNQNVFSDDLKSVLRPSVTEFLWLRFVIGCSHGAVRRPDR